MLASLFARRYLFSAKSRSVINLIASLSVVAVAIPVAAMVILLSVTNGFDSLIHHNYATFDAELQIAPRTGSVFRLEEIDTARLSSLPELEAWSAILEQKILLEANGHQATVTLRGVDDRYPQVMPLEEAVTAGNAQYRLGELHRLILGHATAYELGFRSLLDARVNLYAVRRGSFSSLLPFSNYTRRMLPIVGLFSADYGSEQEYAFAPLELAEELFERPGSVSAILLKGDDPEALSRALEPLLNEELRLVPRSELRASFFRLVKYERWGIFFIALLVLIVASFSVIGALSMLIIEKQEERKTLRALGGSEEFVRSIFRHEGYLICALGALIGLALGILLCLVQQHFGLIKLPGSNFLSENYPVELRWSDLLLIIPSVALIGWILTRLTVDNMIEKERTI
ncbi:MAG: ABC transporter permease [Rikenellaceae bacterium]|nr:ABC transporter permease [Rikenellaceae bacterium]